MEYTSLGYEFGQSTNTGVLHSGTDLNWGSGNDDLGKDCKAMAAGTVVYSDLPASSGWGNMIVIHHPQFNIWTRYAHLQDRLINVGDQVNEGQLIGHVGNSGGNWSAHLHWDVIIKKLASWREYTEGFSQEKLEEFYTDPIIYLSSNPTPMPDDWKTEARDWAMQNGVSNGERPDDPITRVEVWKTLQNYHDRFHSDNDPQ